MSSFQEKIQPIIKNKTLMRNPSLKICSWADFWKSWTQDLRKFGGKGYPKGRK